MFDAPACLSPSQELRLLNGMATRADGKWAASRIGDFGGRQGAGKTDTIIARILAGVMLLGERLIIYTAHEFATANEIYIRLDRLFDDWDDLGRELVAAHRGNTNRGFDLTDGRRILIKTRTGKTGRGFAKADLVIYDEAQHLMPEHVAGSGPAKLAHPNPQSWYAGSGGLATSVKAWEMRRQALTGTGGRLSYTEHTAQIATVSRDGGLSLIDPDPEDRDAWAQANPGLGRWVTEEGMEDMRAELGALFPREGLCVWEPELGLAKLALPNWSALGDGPDEETGHPGSKIVSDRSWALAVSPVEHGPQWAAIGVAGLTAEDRLQIEWMHHRKGTAWVVPTVVDIQKRKKIPLRVHSSGPEAALIDDLLRAGALVEEVSSADVERATGRVIAAADEWNLVHLDQPSMNKAVSGAVLRTGVNGAAIWSQRNSRVEITPLVACTVAVTGVAAPEDAQPIRVSMVIGG